ncbi:hypothetical protein PIB30_070577 [Stylosanthes scabra]|uniref:Uncharacterized protein n=1 Tax=Stylosanthes scabra TaxID=79078 RepID=A0ABU6VM53_9FABA|nr:hypothetical protein [Stylosanthes scabra]
MVEVRETDENGKPMVPVTVDDPYAWVKGEVRDMVSLFVDEESVREIGDPSEWVRARGDVRVQFLLCASEDRVFHKAEGWEYFYMYTTVFLDVGVGFPFTEFEQTTTGGLKNFFKMKSERDMSASNVVKTKKGTVVNQPQEKKKSYSMKRRRAEEGGSGKDKVIDLTAIKCCGKEISLEEVKCITKKQKRLHGYAGEEDLTSVWSEHFPIFIVAEEHFQSKTDLDLIDSVEGVTRAQFMQVYATRLLYIGRYGELKAREEAEQKKEKGLQVQKAIEAEKKLQVATEQLSLKEKEVLELKSDVESLIGKL